MILLDTHIWVWWVQGDSRLGDRNIAQIDACTRNGIGVSVISCWEVAMLESRGRLDLPLALETWIDSALLYPGVVLIPFTTPIAIEACRLPEWSHRDPVDRILVATARMQECMLLTVDRQILEYSHVRATTPAHLISP